LPLALTRVGVLVLFGSASELERDLPFSVFVDALDEYVEGLAPQRLEPVADDVRYELALVLPSLSRFGAGGAGALHHERYRSHRGVRALLERLTAARSLVLALDDLHWADAASVELLGALLRRPPAASVLLALGLRPRQVPQRLAVATERAHSQGMLVHVELDALTRGEGARASRRGARRRGGRRSLRRLRGQPVLSRTARPVARSTRRRSRCRARALADGAGGTSRRCRRAV
jgi:AAA ATPase-like protein